MNNNSNNNNNNNNNNSININDKLLENICKNAGSEYVVLVTIISLTLGQGLSAYEQNLLGNFLQAVGQNLCIMSISKAKCKNDLEKVNYDTINSNIANTSLR